jgi:hypothetical protein
MIFDEKLSLYLSGIKCENFLFRFVDNSDFGQNWYVIAINGKSKKKDRKKIEKE